MSDSRTCEIKDRLLELMSYLSITQSELADTTGISRPDINRYIKGERLPRQDKIGKISETYNVDPAWLMGYDVPMRKKLSSNQALEDFELLDKWHRLNDAQKEIIKLTIDNFLGIPTPKNS